MSEFFGYDCPLPAKTDRNKTIRQSNTQTSKPYQTGQRLLCILQSAPRSAGLPSWKYFCVGNFLIWPSWKYPSTGKTLQDIWCLVLHVVKTKSLLLSPIKTEHYFSVQICYICKGWSKLNMIFSETSLIFATTTWKTGLTNFLFRPNWSCLLVANKYRSPLSITYSSNGSMTRDTFGK